MSIQEKWARVRQIVRRIPAHRDDMRHGASQAVRDSGTRGYVALADALIEMLIDLNEAGALDDAGPASAAGAGQQSDRQDSDPELAVLADQARRALDSYTRATVLVQGPGAHDALVFDLVALGATISTGHGLTQVELGGIAGAATPSLPGALRSWLLWARIADAGIHHGLREAAE